MCRVGGVVVEIGGRWGSCTTMLPESHQCPNGCRRLCCIDARAGGRNAKVWPRYQAPRSLKCGCPPGWKKASTGFSRYVLQTVLKKTFSRLFYMSLKLTLMRRFRGPKKDHHARLRSVHPPGGWRPSALPEVQAASDFLARETSQPRPGEGISSNWLIAEPVLEKKRHGLELTFPPRRRAAGASPTPAPRSPGRT